MGMTSRKCGTATPCCQSYRLFGASPFRFVYSQLPGAMPTLARACAVPRPRLHGPGREDTKLSPEATAVAMGQGILVRTEACPGERRHGTGFGAAQRASREGMRTSRARVQSTQCERTEQELRCGTGGRKASVGRRFSLTLRRVARTIRRAAKLWVIGMECR